MSSYGQPRTFSRHSAACSGCGSVFAAFGTWTGLVGAVQCVEIGILSAPESPSSDRRGATMRKASTSISSLDMSSSFCLRSS